MIRWRGRRKVEGRQERPSRLRWMPDKAVCSCALVRGAIMGKDLQPRDPACPEHGQSMSARLDALEATATRSVATTYGPMLDDMARFWIQKGIEGMRYAVAIENAEFEGHPPSIIRPA